MRDRNFLGFSERIEIDFLRERSKLTSLLCAGRKLLGSIVWIEIGLFFVSGPKMTCFEGEDRLTWV